MCESEVVISRLTGTGLSGTVGGTADTHQSPRVWRRIGVSVRNRRRGYAQEPLNKVATLKCDSDAPMSSLLRKGFVED